jgi:uncharacterized membrane protein YqjE
MRYKGDCWFILRTAFSRNAAKLQEEKGRALRALLMAKFALAFGMKLDTHANLDERHKQLYKRKIRIHGLAILVLVGVISVARKAYRH